jgi:hypothetical protein
MKNILFGLIALLLLVSCESVKNLKNIRNECPEKKTFSNILCKEKK